jgi:hypothetical protein
MSIQTLRKRIALVATVSLGFGLISVVPATAAVSAFAVTESVSTTALTITQPTTTAGAQKFEIFSKDATVALTAISVNPTGTFVSGDPVTIAAGTHLTVGSAAATVYLTVGSASNTVEMVNAALSTYTAVGAFTGLSATTGGTSYVMWVDENGDQVCDFATEEYANITVFLSSPLSAGLTLGTASTTLAGRVGQEVSISPTVITAEVASGSASFPLARIAAAITTQPTPPTGASVVYPKITSLGSLTGYLYANTDGTAGSTAISASTNTTSTSSTVASIDYSGDPGVSVSATTTQASIGTITFTPVAAGTYSLTVWNESSTSGTASLSGSESSQTFTINVSAGVSTITMTTINSTAAKSGSNGSLVKLSLKDASGNAAILAPGESVSVTPSGSAIIAKVNNNAASSTAGQVWNLSASNFNTSGVAWINVTDTVAESPTITASIAGGTSASTTLTFTATVTVAAAPAISSTATGADTTSGTSMLIPIGASTLSWRATASTGSSVIYTVTESLNSNVGTITGYTTALAYDGVGSGNTTLGYASFSVTATTTIAGQSYTLNTDGSTASTVTSIANQTGALTVTPTTVNAVAGSTNSFTVLLKDRFKRAYASQSVSVTVAGKNPTASAATLITDATGRATYSLTDANTNTAVTDTVTFTAGSAAAASVSYGTNAASTVTVASDNYTVTGVANDSVSLNAIATGYAGAQGGARTVTATVKNAAGALLAGVPVVFTVSGTTAAVTSTTATVYTSVSGTASASVYGWATGTYTVTATTGGKSGTATVSFYSTGNDSVRTVSATASGNQVTGMAKDRFGNPVQGATLYAKITAGTGNIGGAITTAGATTDENGKVVWVVSDATSTVTVSNIPFSAVAGTIVGQTSAAVGYDIGGADATAMTAATVGTTTTAETGVGSSFAAAGVSSASVEATVANDASTAADAAAEATDAANAATDAANAAAEAADAATAAAQDAADAVAALSAQVATLISGLKSQLTALTNLVIKIQKKVKA